MERFDIVTMSWTPVLNLQGQNYLPMNSFMASTTMPGTATGVFYGGYNPVSLKYGQKMFCFNLQSGTWVSSVSQAANPFSTVAAPSSPPGPSSSSPSSAGSSSHYNVGAIAGGAAGGVVVIGALVAFLLYNRRKTHQRQGTQHAVESSEVSTSVIMSMKESWENTPLGQKS